MQFDKPLEMLLVIVYPSFAFPRNKLAKALFTSTQKPKIFQNFPSHRIFRRMHGVLNINENKN